MMGSPTRACCAPQRPAGRGEGATSSNREGEGGADAEADAVRGENQGSRERSATVHKMAEETLPFTIVTTTIVTHHYSYHHYSYHHYSYPPL